MNQYMFCDTDISGEEDYDICGSEYRKLIDLCCKYCKIFSVVVTNTTNPIPVKLQPFRIAKPDNIAAANLDYNDLIDSVAYYHICPELCDYLKICVDSIFEWIDGWGFTNPNDPTFYREDGSVFFSSVIHNGVCILNPREEEDVLSVLQNPLWKLKA